MNKTLTINGMHCHGCQNLIQMVLEDNDLGERIKSMNLHADNIGTVELENVTEEEVNKAKDVINKMENYKVAE